MTDLTNDEINKRLAFEDEIRKDIVRRDKEKLQRINDCIHNKLNAKRKQDQAELERLEREFDNSNMKVSKERYNKAVNDAKKRMKSLTGKNYIVSKKSNNRLLKNMLNRKDYSNTFIRSAIKNRDKPFKKVTTGVFKTTNFSGKSKGKDSTSALETELKHILRLLNDNTYKEDLVKNNLVEINGQTFDISNIDTRQELKGLLMSEVSKIKKDYSKELSNRTRLQNEAEKVQKRYRSKKSNIEKMIDDIDEPSLKSDLKTFKFKFFNLDNPTIQSDFSDINKLKEKVKSYFKNSLSEEHQELTDNQINNLVNRKVKLIDSFLETRNEAINAVEKRDNFDSKISRSDTPLFKEFLFKLPHHAGEFDITQQEYLDSVKSYFDKNFSEYEMLVGVVHFDEVQNPEKRTGDHVHLVMKTQNKNTGKYDLNSKYRDLGMRLAKVENKNMNKNELIKSGQLLNAHFLLHIQKQLFDKKDICLTLLSNEEKLDFHNLIMSFEQDMPQELRTLNSFKMDYDQIQRYKQNVQKQKYIIKNNKTILQNQKDKYSKQKEDFKIELFELKSNAKESIHNIKGELIDWLDKISEKEWVQAERIAENVSNEIVKNLPDNDSKFVKIEYDLTHLENLMNVPIKSRVSDKLNKKKSLKL
ncbi:hypothetical protein [Shewanella algae]|uniref:hypothetical protein n=1 Tax=Shewanella algae TaxID=38313 RepID=UPI0011825542|nr:hypothetical protein [Shewanella algae]TVP08473.1 hypothetical protein AYI73_01005 [Shewanella algae]